MGGHMTPTGASDAIPQEQRALIAAIGGAIENAYLVGGVAVAAYLEHRTSLDVDLFLAGDFDPDALAERLRSAVPVIVTSRAEGTLHAEVDGFPLSVLRYRYPLLAPTRRVPGLDIAVASPEDLVAMKLWAIAGRGAAKDFWDLDALLASGVAGGRLDAALDLFRAKYAHEDVGHVVRSLAYFGDADAAPLPLGLTLSHWNALKQSMAARVKSL
jgi:hypothetical protein